jgi:transcription elongation GreA/GreB family factor
MTHPLTKLQENLEDHLEKERGQWQRTDELFELIKSLAEVQKEQSIKLDELKVAMESWIEVHKTAKGLQKFIVWLGGFGITWALVVEAVHRFLGGK